MVSGAKTIGKDPNHCEDAYFIHKFGMGVADGVSGWAEYGIDSSAFSNSLMANAVDEIDKLFGV